jgi:hypothetical protein
MAIYKWYYLQDGSYWSFQCTGWKLSLSSCGRLNGHSTRLYFHWVKHKAHSPFAILLIHTRSPQFVPSRQRMTNAKLLSTLTPFRSLMQAVLRMLPLLYLQMEDTVATMATTIVNMSTVSRRAYGSLWSVTVLVTQLRPMGQGRK